MTDTDRPAAYRRQPLAVAIIGLLFFIFGFVTWLNGSLIPYLKVVCDLDTSEAFLVTFAFYIAYTVMALPMAAVLARTGYRNGMALGLAVMSVGALIHIPAAQWSSFPIFLVGLFTLGTGLTILQTASNPYIVLLGPIESAARRISIMGIVNKGAGVIVPMVFASLVLSKLGNRGMVAAPLDPAARQALATHLIMPYLVMAGVLLLLVGFVRLAPLPEVAPEPVVDRPRAEGLMAKPRFVLGVVTLFAYMGLEVMAGDTIGLFGQSLGVANFLSLTSYTMGFMVVGYVLGIVLIPRFVGQRSALIACGIAGLAGTFGILVANPDSASFSTALWGWTSIPAIPDPVFFVATLGLAHALVWPTLWPLAIKGLGDATPRGSALLIMGISGGAVIPLLFGWISSTLVDIQHAYAIALPCYAMILFYGAKGATIERWGRAHPHR